MVERERRVARPIGVAFRGVITIRRLLSVLVLLIVTGAVAVVASAQGPAEPAQVVDVPTTAGETKTFTWDGTVPAGSDPIFSSCDFAPARDSERFDVRVPEGTYDRVKVTFEFKITWTPNSPGGAATSDEKLTVINPAILAASSEDEDEGDSREVGNSDGGEPVEIVTGTNLTAATYQALACPAINTNPQPYKGTLTLRAEAVTGSLPAAPSGGQLSLIHI